MENWKNIEFGNGRFAVSDHGNIRNNITGDTLSQQTQNSGYRIAHMNYNGKRVAKTVHRLVATAFIPNPENKPQVNHIDGNKLNNSVSNLEWATTSENIRHAGSKGLMTNRDEKARERMRKLGRKNAKANGDRLKQLNAAKRKPVVQYSLTDEFVKEWESVRAIRRAGVAGNVGKVLSGTYSQSGGYKWRWK